MIATSLAPTQTSKTSLWQPATWSEYEHQRDESEAGDRQRLFFHNQYLRMDSMGWEGIDHSEIRELFIMLFAFWFAQHPDQKAKSLGGCLIEKTGQTAAAPDLVIYLGDNAPIWKPKEKRRIDLNKWRVPDLVGEVSDTTLSSDLDEMKQLYAALGIPEYWVINVKGRQVLAFGLQENGKYQPIETSLTLTGLPIALLEQTLDRLTEESNINAAQWFMGELKMKNEETF